MITGTPPFSRAIAASVQHIDSAVAVIPNEAEAGRFRSIGVLPVTDRNLPPGLDPERIGQWMRREQERTLAGRRAVAA